MVAYRNSVSTSKNKHYIKSEHDSLLSEDIKITTTKFAAMVQLVEKQFLKRWNNMKQRKVVVAVAAAAALV